MAFAEFIEKVKETSPLKGGSEKTVFVHPGNFEHVIGVYSRQQDSQRLKGIFYISKIAHLLFPKNIPNVYRVTTEPPTIEKKRLHFTAFREEDRDTLAFQRLLREFRDAGIDVDRNTVNFGYDSTQNTVYLDDLNFHYYLDKDRLQSAIKTLLSGTTQAKALRWFKRMPVSN